MTTKSYTKSHPETIKEMFNDIAENYEMGNAVLSFQTYRLWNRALIHHIYEKQQPTALLDLCCGTGDIALPYLKKREEACKAYLLDFSSGMLDYAKAKAKRWKLDRHDMRFLEADAQQIPLPSNSVDCVTVAYGIRNIQDPRKCYHETLRLLRSGGSFGILELTRPQNPLLKSAHHLYLTTALPLMGKLVTSNQEAYRYLCNSIHDFVKPERVAVDLKEIGFTDVQVKPMLGGVATMILAKKL